LAPSSRSAQRAPACTHSRHRGRQKSHVVAEFGGAGGAEPRGVPCTSRGSHIMSRTQFGGLAPDPGQRAVGWVGVPGVEPPWEMPAFVIRGRQPGPTLAVTAGIHAAEYPGIASATRLARDVDPAALRGSSYSAAARLGVPSIIAEVGQQGIYDQDSVERHLAGLRNVLVHLRMLEGRPSPVTRPQRLSRFAWMYADATATYHPVVAAGQVVTEGQSIGALRDIFGETVQ